MSLEDKIPANVPPEVVGIIKDFGKIVDGLVEAKSLSFNFISTKQAPTKDHGVIFIVLTGDFEKSEVDMMVETSLAIVNNEYARTRKPDVPGNTE